MAADKYHIPVVLNAVLTYISNGLDNSPVEYISRCVHDFYTLEELTDAKDILWYVGDKDVIPKFTRRRDTSNRSVIDATISDIIEAIQALDAADIMPHFAVDRICLQRLPRVSPAEISSISVCERLAKLEQRMSTNEDSISVNVGKVIRLEESFSRTTYAGIAGRSPTENQTIVPERLVVNMPPPRTVPRQETRSYRGPSRRNEVPTMTSAVSMQSLVSNSSRPSAYRDGFEYPAAHRRKSRRQKPVTGTSTVQGTLRGAPEPSRDIFVYRVQKGNTSEVIHNHITSSDIEPRSVTMVSNSEAKFDSFKVVIKLSDMHKILSPDFWPEGVCVRRFFKPRNDS